MLNHHRWSIAVAVLALGSVGLWFAFAPSVKSAERSQPEESTVARAPAQQTFVRAAAPAEARAPAVHTGPPAAVMKPRTRVVGPSPSDPHEPGMLPHPLDEAHERIQAENALIQALNDAMSFRNIDEMRAMLVEYRELDPNDVDALQLGYEVIADCIEFPGDASLTAAREFYATERHSPLRRFVRRICFENSN